MIRAFSALNSGESIYRRICKDKMRSKVYVVQFLSIAIAITRVHIYVYICMYACMYVSVYVYMYVYVCMYICIYVCMDV